MNINVTQEHIENGKTHSAHCCPIALAFKELGFKYPCVGTTDVFIPDEDNIGQIYALPEEAKSFIFRFDNGADVVPFQFTARQLERSYDNKTDGE